MLIGPPLRYSCFKEWPWKSKVKAMGEVWSHNTSLASYRFTSTLPFLRHSIFKIWPWKSKVKVIAQGHTVGITLSTHIPFVPCRLALPFLGHSYFKIWCWKFQVKIMGEVKVESHNMGPTFGRLTSLSFHVNRESHSWVMTFCKFDLENQGTKVMVEVTVQSHNVGLTSYRIASL